MELVALSALLRDIISRGGMQVEFVWSVYCQVIALTRIHNVLNCSAFKELLYHNRQR
jgi:hypothetical protein